MITQERLKELLHYCPNTGVFTNKVSRGNISADQVVGCRTKAKSKQAIYIVIMLDKTLYRAHRLAWLYVYGDWPKYTVDHINGSGEDNRIANLRDVPCSEQQKNLPQQKNNTSGVTGVVWLKDKLKWRAQIKVSGRIKYLGTYADKADAVAARALAERKYGFHPNHGRQF